MNQKYFTKNILDWGKQNDRPMPWKGEKNPYYIWLSEIILQQTRVEQGTKYFLAFKKNYLTIFDLAQAKETEVLKLWEGLGYYSRARNLHFTAKYIANDLEGVFPRNYTDLLKLKGVGSYTASAIASFAYDIPKAVVDGNVIRVLSRFFGIENTFQTVKEKKEFQEIADVLISKKSAADYNQAIMDFGAQICTPKNYQCEKCPISANCFAYKNKQQNNLPLKKKKVKVKERFFYFLVLNIDNTTYIEQRQNNDIWKGLFQFPLIETQQLINKPKELEKLITNKINVRFKVKKRSKNFTQKLTHQKLNAIFIEIDLKTKINKQFINTDINNLSKFAFPKIINVYLSYKISNNNGK